MKTTAATLQAVLAVAAGLSVERHLESTSSYRDSDGNTFSSSYSDAGDGSAPFAAVEANGRSSRSNFLGCLFSAEVCNEDETCFDDNLFGRCFTQSDLEEGEPNTFSELSDGDRALLTVELDRLRLSGLTWHHDYAQCILQNIEEAIVDNAAFSESHCDLFLGDAASDMLDSFDEEEKEREESLVLADDGSVVPKKMIILGDEDIFAPSGNAIGQDDSREFEEQEPVQQLGSYNGIESAAPFEKRSHDARLEVVNSEESDFPGYQGMSKEQLDMATYLAMKDALSNAVAMENEEDEGAADWEDEEALSEEEGPSEEVGEATIYWPSEEADGSLEYIPADFYALLQQQNGAAARTSDVRKVGKRAGDNRAFDSYDDADDDYYFQDGSDESLDDSDNLVYEYEEEVEREPRFVRGVVSRPSLVGGLASTVFNRNERLDVKKPGPFYKNSANNFFLDKLLKEEYKEGKEGEDKDGKNSIPAQDMGQVEYEMPLLAPPRDRKRALGASSFVAPPSPFGRRAGTPGKEVGVVEEGGDKATPEFVHVAIKDRFDSWRQGSELIELLATAFGVPSQALTDRKIDDRHVQFYVAPNPQSVDAVQMAKRLDTDAGLRSRIDDQIGVEIQNAAPGHQNDVSSVLFPSGANFNLLLLTVMAASTTAALLVVGVILLLVKRRHRISRKQNLLAGGGADLAGAEEKATTTDEYKQLCRDWSRSSRKVSNDHGSNSAAGSATNAKKQVQNQESKESNRSSTSSWPEEPNTANMDISTGHMVLAYMEDHLKNKQRLEQEWVSLCGYEAEPCATTVAFKTDNKKKNRYPDKLPYDHNRVILNAMVNGSGSDYINASAVTDHDPRNPSYIITQAPLATTVADFWQMIWEQGCVVIVMLTQLNDNGHQLCHRYWPEKNSEQYHIFEVHLVSEHVWCDDYLVRSVYLKNTRTGETRTVTQFHFKSWPASGTPTSTKALLEFRRKVNKSYRGRSCPIAVHCSDGVGRSGTYVLIDMVLNRMAKGTKEIDIAATLEHIRDQRGGTVQTRQQFEFCLTAVAEEVHAILKALPQ